MTPRERWLAVLSRQKPDRVPMDYWATGEATARLLDYLECDFETMLARLHIDSPVRAAGRYAGPPPADGADIFGIVRRPVDYGSGAYSEVVFHPLAQYRTADEIEDRYAWPSPDHWDYSHLPKESQSFGERPVIGGGSEPFLLYKQLRGDEQAYVDLVENPGIVHACLDRLFDLAYQDALRIFETIPGKVDLTYVAEDLGGQTGLLYSPAHIREYLLPRMKRMMDLTRQHGSHVFHHSDGAIREILPDLIETGIQILNPIQWRLTGMDREGLKADFGDRVIFHGGVDNQETLPFGSVADVRREVEDNLRILGGGGGYILAPCHNIQSITPPENIVALYDAGYEMGRL